MSWRFQFNKKASICLNWCTRILRRNTVLN